MSTTLLRPWVPLLKPSSMLQIKIAWYCLDLQDVIALMLHNRIILILCAFTASGWKHSNYFPTRFLLYILIVITEIISCDLPRQQFWHSLKIPNVVIRDSKKKHVAATRDELSKLNIIGRRLQRKIIFFVVLIPKSFSSS